MKKECFLTPSIGLSLCHQAVAKYLNITLDQALRDARSQISIIQTIQDLFPKSIMMTPMDVTLEAECFGLKLKFLNDRMPQILFTPLSSMDMIDELQVPGLDGLRIPYIFEIIKQIEKKNDLVVNITGPLTIAMLLLGYDAFMKGIVMYPKKVHILLEKITTFLITYVSSLKKHGVLGIMISDPSSASLSYLEAKTFNQPYLNQVIRSCKDETFPVIYHTCANMVNQKESLKDIEADIYHFGNANNIEEMARFIPKHKIVMGNIDPVNVIQKGDASFISQTVETVLDMMKHYPHFHIAIGCDVPYHTKIEHLQAFQAAILKYK